MITELAVERVAFACGGCWNEWSTDYDVQHYRDADGRHWEYFSCDGVPVPSPYTPRGAVPCPRCGRRWVGRVLARRIVPRPPGETDTPREEILSHAGHRPERHGARPLGASAHSQPEQPGPPPHEVAAPPAPRSAE
ncbi:hypothetical protein [Streptomyces sp. A1136]|uniref:hypothetical protein n=1 Tax=Streptomyces sp. A1136 TaxID=2563102 RepID=UPI00109E759C|nr:hypothetical protein [Streptomyces sp. A1136]THA46371.1 hypothetical protein E6R62_33990 [Streptomyces sp. A1136]